MRAGLDERRRRGDKGACWSPPSPRTRRGCRRWARSRWRPGGSCASPAARSIASSRSPRRPAICKDFPPTIDFDAAMRLPRDEVMIVATGGQGEARAALARIADDSHQIKLGDGDTVLFSSKQIPGNEVAIGRIQNALAGRGIEHGHRAAGARPRLRPSRAAPSSTRCTAGSGPRSSCRCMARCATWPSRRASRCRSACRARWCRPNGDVVRLAPERAEEDRPRARRPAGARRRRDPRRPMARR